MNITKEQTKILIAVFITTVLFIIFWVFVYLPAGNSVKTLKAELIQLENKINALEGIIGKDKSLEEGFFMLEEELKRLDGKFPGNEEETLRILSSLAYKHGLNVISIKPQPKVPFLDENENTIEIEGKFCQKMPISIVVRAGYLKIGKFLEALDKDIPHFLTVEKLKISRELKLDELEAEINLTMYLLAGKGK